MKKLLVALFALVPTFAWAAPNTTTVPTSLQNTPCSASQILWGAGSGVAPACLTVGSGLTISGGTITAAGGGGSVSGPGSSTSGDLAIWNNTSGTLLKDQSLTATLDAAIGSTQGSIMYRNSTVWTPLTPGTSGYVLTTQGSSANPIWSNVSGSTGCTVSGGSQYNILINNGSSGCSSDANASANAGALSLGSSGTLGSVILGNATSGTITLQPVTGALGTPTLLIPAASGTIATVANINTALPSATTSQLYGGTGSAGVAQAVSLTTTGSSGAATLSGGTLNIPVYSGGGGTPGGSNTQVQYNNSGSFGGAAGFTFDGTSKITLGVAGTSTGAIALTNGTSGNITLQPVTGALGTPTLLVPAASGTIATTTNINTALPSATTSQIYGGSGSAGVASVLGLGTGLAVSGGNLTITAVTGVTCFGSTITTTGTCTTTGQLPGTATNDNASSGNIGEYIGGQVLSGSAVTATSAAPFNITSWTLSAGDWDCRATVQWTSSSGAAVSVTSGWLNTTSATAPSGSGSSAYALDLGITRAANAIGAFPVGTQRFSLSTSTVVYLGAQFNFASGSVVAYGAGACRRAR